MIAYAPRMIDGLGHRLALLAIRHARGREPGRAFFVLFDHTTLGVDWQVPSRATAATVISAVAGTFARSNNERNDPRV